MRDPAVHADAAYLASIRATRELCTRIYKDSDPDDRDEHLGVGRTENNLIGGIGIEACPDLRNHKYRQKDLSDLVDKE